MRKALPQGRTATQCQIPTEILDVPGMCRYIVLMEITALAARGGSDLLDTLSSCQKNLPASI